MSYIFFQNKTLVLAAVIIVSALYLLGSPTLTYANSESFFMDLDKSVAICDKKCTSLKGEERDKCFKDCLGQECKKVVPKYFSVEKSCKDDCVAIYTMQTASCYAGRVPSLTCLRQASRNFEKCMKKCK